VVGEASGAGAVAGAAGEVGARAHILGNAIDEPREPVDDVERAVPEGEPPVPGAQWDEVHERWEAWDEATQRWVVVGESHGDDVEPDQENLLPPLLARELQHADDLDAVDDPDVPDVERKPEPPAHVPGAQWNEVAGRWEQWDDAAGAWVEVPTN
jgi:hypothetical protein